MPIEFDCPTCKNRIRTPDEAAGKKARCPQCGDISSIPYGSQSSSDQQPATWSELPAAAVDLQSPFASGLPRETQNPFRDSLAAGSGHPTNDVNLNPYASPAMAGSSWQQPLTADDVRRKLLGPAIGIAMGGFFCLSYMALVVASMVIEGKFGAAAPDDGFERAMYFGGMGLGLFAFCIPGILMLLGAFAMFRAQGKQAAWAGAIASVLPCSPCCIVGIGFGIWGMVVLSDPRVARILKASK